VSKNVAVFVDVANIFYAAKAAGADIDYVTLLKAAVAGRDFVRAYAYTGLDPENENQRNFHSFLARHGYKVVSKDIRKYGDGKVKANLDIELVVDMMKTARNLDVAIVVSGDGDFAPAIRAVQEMGVRVEVISFRGNTSSDLIEVADVFYDIMQVARVDRDSSRSGRRVAGDDEDLSMTEVPDKQTEGRGGRRGRGGRSGGRSAEPVEALVAAPIRDGRSGRGGRGIVSRTAPRIAAEPAATSAGGGRLVALPGEKLSRAGSGESGEPLAAEGIEPLDEEQLVEIEVFGEAPEGEAAEGTEGAEGAESTGRRRRRRGGRGRGHGRTAEQGVLADAEPAESVDAIDDIDDEELAADAPVAPSKPRPNQFGSFWDSQIGMVGRPERLTPSTADEEDFTEPEIPEYLLAERRRGGRGQGGNQGGGRGGMRGGGGNRSAYASAVDRERYGSRGTSSRYPEPAPRPIPQSQPPRRRDDRPVRQAPVPQQHRGLPRSSGGGRDSAEPWSEVPPELEELLRAQLSTKLSRPSEPAAGAPRSQRTATAPEKVADTGAPTEAEATAEAAPKRRAPARRKAEPAVAAETPAVAEVAAPSEAAEAAPKRRAPARRKAAVSEPTAAAEAPAEAPAAEAAPKRRAPARRKAAAPAEGGDTSAE
jgi:uncharacterized LabA/DUF88 family protein